MLSEFLHNAWSFLAIISFIIFIHELGHYSVAKFNGVKIETFSLGFGKELIGWNDKSGTRWKISLLPMGGYVKMYGDKNAASMEDQEFIDSLSEKERKQSFHTQSIAAKSAIIAAGPIANFLLSIMVLTFCFSFYGTIFFEPIVTKIMPGSAAEIAGIKINDKIVSLDHTKIHSFSEIEQIIALNTNTTIEATIIRNGESLNFILTPKLTEKTDPLGKKILTPILGIGSDLFKLKKHSIIQSASLATKEIYNMSKITLVALGQMISGKRNSDEIGGPIKIAQYSGASTKSGLYSSLWFIAILSCNLGVFNLLPIPMLDGGHLFYYLIQSIYKKPINKNIIEYAFRIGLFFLLFIMVFAIFNDIKSLFAK